MYGSSVQYGWNSNPGIRTSDVIELPLAPVRRPTGAGHCCRCMNWHTFGILLSLLAASSLALGVADVVITYQNYMVGQSCSTNTTPTICSPNTLLWTWIGVGIWASVPVFIFGIMAIRRGSNPMTQNCWFEIFAFLCAFIFTIAMIVLSALEVYKGANIYYWTYQSPLTANDLVKAIIPIVIAGLGLLEHIMCFGAFWDICCCQGPRMTTYAAEPVQMMRAPAVMSAPPMIRPSTSCNTCPQPAYGGSSFYSPRGATTYNYSTSCGPCGGSSPYNRQLGPNPAYNFFRG